MSSTEGSTRRGWITGLAGGTVALVALRGVAQAQDAGATAKPGDAGVPKKPAATPKPHAGPDHPPGHDHASHEHHDAPPALALTPAQKLLVESTADCQRAGRVCLARCTEHLAAGMSAMAACQRAVMNMLSVVGAMAEVAAYASADPKLIKQLAKTCAAYCRACAAACQPHAVQHEECKACEEACNACAKACEAMAA
jgi:Cys-rich four helix bundle protein (predicted Tat secretion target)